MLMRDLHLLFVLGCPRSGTTMLQQALNRHSRIVIPPETKLFFSFLGHCRKCQNRHIERLNRDLGIQLPKPKVAVTSLSDARRFYLDMANLYLERVKRPSVSYFGEKTPEHTGFAFTIRRHFPKAKFLLIYRDGRDVALSLTKVPWMHPSLYANFLVWLYYYHQQKKLSQERTLDLHTVRYEDLVNDPEKELKRITKFLQLPFERALSEGFGNRDGVPEREYPWKAQSLERITAARVGVWRNELLPIQVGILERLGGGALKALGYELQTDSKVRLPLLLFPRLIWDCSRFALRLPFGSVSNQFFGRAFCLH